MILAKQHSAASFKTALGKMTEVFIVLILGFGLFIYSSTIAILENSVTSNTKTYNSYDFIFIIVYEVIMLTIITCFLKSRQWSYKDFNLDFSVKMVGVAILLVIIRETSGAFITQALIGLNILNPETLHDPSITLQSNMVSMALIAVVNSIYEEVLLIGYLFRRFEKYHPAMVIAISFLVRASYHTYQGWMNMPMVFVLALVFGIYYIKYKKLWPLIIAHGIGNVFHFLNEYYRWLS